MGKLLVIADNQKLCAATPRGLELAQRLGLAVEVVAFAWAPLKGLASDARERAELRQQLLNQREAQMEAQIDKHRQAGQKISLKVVWAKDIVPWVLRRAESGSYEMVVKAGNRSESIAHTPSDWQLLRECPLPVLIVSRNKWERTQPILAAVDLGSRNRDKQNLNRSIVKMAQGFAQALEVDLKVIAAVEVPALLSELDMIDPVAYVKQQKAEMAPALKKLREAFDLPASTVTIKRGPVDKVITSQAAKVRAQLVVMGTVGRKGVKARLLGNTAESVLTLLHTDVLALKP